MRYLCSHLVTLAGVAVNLEEIWQEGAVLECEEAPAVGPAELRCDGVLFAGRIVRVTEHAFGWRAELEFSPLMPWSIERFRPGHLLAIESP